jgi:AcrR family transcriptional regulator
VVWYLTMSGIPSSDRRARRRQETVDEVVAAAWELVREQGLVGLSLRDLGERVGMRAQSLYSYFASKHEIYDAMFLQGNEAFLEWMRETSDPGTDGSARPADLRRVAHRFFEFCVSDPVRYQLLFQRTIPDFVPSERSYAVAQAAYKLTVDWLAAVGIDQSGVDLWTAVLAGLVAQQLSNDPGGDRWLVLVDRAVDMLFTELVPAPRKKAIARGSR